MSICFDFVSFDSVCFSVVITFGNYQDWLTYFILYVLFEEINLGETVLYNENL